MAEVCKGLYLCFRILNLDMSDTGHIVQECNKKTVKHNTPQKKRRVRMSGQKLKEDIGQPGSLGGNTPIRLPHRRLKPQFQHANVQYRTYHIPNEETDSTGFPINNCSNCKQAIGSLNRFFCAKMRESVDRIVDCPHFELEPLSYRLFIRT